MFKLLTLSLFLVSSSQSLLVHAYPSSVSLTTDVTISDILADIPLFSVGLVGFGVYTFFFVMRRINRITNYIHLSVLLGFVAAIFDLSQIIRRGYWDTKYDLNISSVQVLIILRELGHAFSFAFRFIFFWAFVSEPPRGELPFVPMQDDRRPNFISLSSEEVIHSGDWARYRSTGLIFKWALLLLTLSVPVLQILWRLVNMFNMFGPIYIVESGIEIGLSAVFITKLVINTFTSPLSPRLNTLRDYMPVILAISIGMGLAIGNLLCFKFTESTLGRFLQAVELYILVLFVLISAFYKMPVRSSVVAELVRRRLTAAGFGDLEATGGGNTRQSQLSMVQAPYSMPTEMGTQRENEGSRQMLQVDRPTITQRISTGSIFNSRFMSSRRSNSGQLRGFAVEGAGEEGYHDQRRLWNKDDESNRGPSPGGQRSFRTSIEQTPDQTPNAATSEAPGWKDPVFTSVMRNEEASRGESSFPVSAATKEKDTEKEKTWRESNPQIVVPDDASQYTTDSPRLESPPRLPYNRDETESPIYGLDGIIRNLQASGNVQDFADSNRSSAQSSGIESLLRQQQELDKSIAGLRRFSTASTARTTMSRKPDSLQSDISLSNFPEPPFFAKSPTMSNSTMSIPKGLRVIDEDAASIPKTEISRSKSMAVSAISDNSMIVDDVTFQLMPPRMPAVMAEHPERSQNLSVPSIARESMDSVFNEGPSRGIRTGSQGTQYDVTSFIGGLTAPASHRISPPLTNISERDRSTDSDSGSVVPATIADLTRVQVVDARRPSEDSVPDSGIGADSSNMIPLFVPPVPTVTPPEQSMQPLTRSPPQNLRPLLLPSSLQLGRARGLPTGPRGRLEISNPILQSAGALGERMLSERTMFQRPRPAPLVLRDSNDPRPTSPEKPTDGGYF